MPTDEELKRAFHDLQIMMADAKQKIAEGEAEKHRCTARSQIAELTKEQLSTLPDDSLMFHSLGQMFVLSNKADEIVHNVNEIEECRKKMQDLEAQKNFLQKNVEISEKNLREMVNVARRRE